MELRHRKQSRFTAITDYGIVLFRFVYRGKKCCMFVLPHSVYIIKKICVNPMEPKENHGLLTMRGVLKSIGLASAAAISSPFVHAGESAVKAATLKTSSAAKVGLLLPSAGAEGYSSSFIN